VKNLEKINDCWVANKIIFGQSVDLIKRNPQKYGKMVLGLHLTPLIMGNTCCRDAYFFMRHVDDVLDGDLDIGRNPLEYVDEIRTDISNINEVHTHNIGILAKKSLNFLEKRKKETDNPRQDFLNGIDVMIQDNKRMVSKQVLTDLELKKYHNNSFDPYFNILFMCMNSGIRSSDINTFSYSQGFSYAIRDLEADWQKGLINIPKEILEQANLLGNTDFREVNSNLIVREWIGEESYRTKSILIQSLEDISKKPNEKRAIFLINGLSKTVENILETNIQPRKIISVSGNN